MILTFRVKLYVTIYGVIIIRYYVSLDGSDIDMIRADNPLKCLPNTTPVLQTTVTLDDSDAYNDTDDDDTNDDEHWSESVDSDERVLEENWTGQLMMMYEDLMLD